MSERLQYENTINHYDVIEFRRCILRGNPTEVELLYKKYGPANPHRAVALNNIDNDEFQCKKSPSGICQMMTCMCHEEYKDWYTGMCEYCDCKIDCKEEAWRTALVNGGFIGCFCSHVHATNNIREDEKSIIYSISKVMFAIRDRFPVQNLDDFNKELKNDEKIENGDF